MSGREEDLKTALREICMMGLGVVARPRDGNARAALRRACLHGNSILKLQVAADQVDALAPQDPRPEAPTPEAAPAIPEPAPAAPFKPRLPYKEDD